MHHPFLFRPVVNPASFARVRALCRASFSFRLLSSLSWLGGPTRAVVRRHR